MSSHPHLYHQLLKYVGQYSKYSDRRHLMTLSWMVVGVLLSQSLHLTEWEPFVISRATKAQSYQKRWSRFLQNSRIEEEKLYLPLVMAAISHWSNQRIYLALDTTMLWNQYCMIHLSIICGGRAIPFLWQVEKHNSATISFVAYQSLLRKASWLLRHHDDVMILADRGFAHQELLDWLGKRAWHFCIRIKSDTLIHGVHRWRACPVSQLRTVRGEAKMYHQVRLWESGTTVVNLAHAYPTGTAEPWTIITDEVPTLQTFRQYGLRTCGEQCAFVESKSCSSIVNLESLD